MSLKNSEATVKAEKTDVLIIGAGPTGLGAALRLMQNNSDWQLLEASSEFGGLATSFVDDVGFTWDLGAHVEFSHYEEFDRWMNIALGEDGWITHRRKTWIRFEDRWIPYPLQYHLHHLPAEQRWLCVRDFLRCSQSDSQGSQQARNYDQWISLALGETFNSLFLRPYSYKVWGYPNTELGMNWVNERVAVPNLEDVLRGICLEEDYHSWGPNHLFRYPRRGGMGAVWKQLGERLSSERVTFRSRVTRIDSHTRTVTTDDGRTIMFESLITTIPLDQLLVTAPNVVSDRFDGQFLFATTHIVGIGIQGQPPDWLKDMCWMYFPGANSPYFRVSVSSNFSPQNVPHPGKQWSVLAEVSSSRSKTVCEETLVVDVISALERDGILVDPSQIVSKVKRRIPYGYPVPFLHRDNIVDPILQSFDSHGIYSRGRFGAWKYEISNQDYSFMQGVEVVDRILYGSEERTLRCEFRNV